MALEKYEEENLSTSRGGDTRGVHRGKSDFLIEAISKEIQTERLFVSKHRSAHSSIKSIFSRCFGSAVACSISVVIF